MIFPSEAKTMAQPSPARRSRQPNPEYLKSTPNVMPSLTTNNTKRNIGVMKQ